MIDGSDLANIVTVFLMGLMGAGHCIGMCGGIVTALGLSSAGSQKGLLVTAYNIGRISSYAFAGALVGLLGYWSATYLALGFYLRLLAGLLLILMGLYLGNWWNVLVNLEKLGAGLWRRIQPIGQKFFPPTNFKQALVLGMFWGWLPCGLVYSALVYSATAQGPLHGAILMLAFGLGTSPAMVLGGFFSSKVSDVIQNLRVRQVMGVVMIILGVWTLSVSVQHNLKSETHHLVP